MNVAAGQTARPSIASNFTTAARENQHPRLAKQAIVRRYHQVRPGADKSSRDRSCSRHKEAMAPPEELRAQAQGVSPQVQ